MKTFQNHSIKNVKEDSVPEDLVSYIAAAPKTRYHYKNQLTARVRKENDPEMLKRYEVALKIINNYLQDLPEEQQPEGFKVHRIAEKTLYERAAYALKQTLPVEIGLHVASYVSLGEAGHMAGVQLSFAARIKREEYERIKVLPEEMQDDAGREALWQSLVVQRQKEKASTAEEHSFT